MLNKIKRFSIVFVITISLLQPTIFGMNHQQIDNDPAQWDENKWAEAILSFQEHYNSNCFKLVHLYKKIYSKKYGSSDKPSPVPTRSNQNSIDHEKLLGILLYKSCIETLLYKNYIDLHHNSLNLDFLYRLYKADLYQRFNLNFKQKLLTSPEIALSYSLPSTSMWDSLKQIFFAPTTNTHITLKCIKSDLTKLINYLKKNDIQNDQWQQEDIARKYKQLWNDFLRLHNHTWLDQILYPHHPSIDTEEEAKFRRQLLFSLHPDKEQSIINATQKNELYTNFTDISRPIKPLDPIIDSYSFMASFVGYRTGMQTISTISSLPSILFPQYFTNKAIASYAKDTAKEKLEIKRYNNAIAKHKTYIKQHETTIKRKECSIRKKQEYIRDLIKVFSPKKPTVN